MSEWSVEVVRLGKIEKHPNADRLEITQVHGGYPCILAEDLFKEGDLAVYIPVDSIVPATDPRFQFLIPQPTHKEDMSDLEWAERLRRYQHDLEGTVRIKAKKLRGVFSMGLLIPAESGWREGQNVASELKIEKYEPDESNRRLGKGGQITGGDSEKDPGFLSEYTDIEGLRKWSKILQEGEEVTLTEKLHGCCSRYLFHQGRLWVGSRHQIKRAPHKVTVAELSAYTMEMRAYAIVSFFYGFLATILGSFFTRKVKAPRVPREPRDVKTSTWWQVAFDYDLTSKLAAVPGIAVYGEIYGPIQDLRYGSPTKPRFAAFDAMDLTTRRWYDHDDFVALMKRLDLPTVPVLYRGPWKKDLRMLAEGKTTLPGADHVREGFVVKPVKERHHDRLGRVILKAISENYLLR